MGDRQYMITCYNYNEYKFFLKEIIGQIDLFGYYLIISSTYNEKGEFYNIIIKGNEKDLLNIKNFISSIQ